MSRWPIKPLLGAADLTTTRVGAFAGARPYVSTGDVDGTAVVGSESVSFADRPSRADLVANKGDVLFARMQATNKVIVVNRETEDHLWSTGFAALRPKAGTTSPRWLGYWLGSSFFNERKDSLCTGATQKAITNDGIRELEIPLPPLSEQERIVRILDDAEALYRLRIQADSRLAQAVPACFSRLFGDPTSNSMGLQTAKLGRIANLERGKFTPRPRNDPAYFGGSYPFIQTGDISSSGGLLSRWQQTLNERGKAVSKEFSTGTIVFAIVGATIGATAILQVPVYCPDSIIGIQVDPAQAVTEYVEFILRARRPLLLAQAPDAARANLNLEIVRDLDIPLAPLADQSRFVESLLETRQLAAAQSASRQRLDDLFQSLLHRAFQGEL